MLRVRILSLQSAELLLEAGFTNPRANDVFLVDTLPGSGTARHQPAPERAYVMRWPAGIRVGKFLVQVPDGMDAAAPEVPYAVRLAPGAAHVTRLRIPLPLAASHPYLRGAPAPAGPGLAVSEIGVVLGVFDSRRFPPNAAVMTPAPTIGPLLYRVSYGWGVELQELVGQPLGFAAPGLPARL